MKLVLTFNSNLFIQGETTKTQKVHSIFERQKYINSKWRERDREICQFWAGGGVGGGRVGGGGEEGIK